MQRITFVIFFIYFSTGTLLAQSSGKEINSLKPLWSVNPFDRDVFIPNAGQFTEVPFSTDIQYTVSYGPLNIYFTVNGMVFAHAEADTTYKNLSREELIEKAKELKAANADTIKRKVNYLNLSWVGANTSPIITAEEEQTGFYGYYVNGRDIHVNVFKKIVYHDLYPGIDAEYTFPEIKNGKKYSSIKYALIVHSGANLSRIKIKYSGTTCGLKKDDQRNVIISTPMGDFIDHAPIIYYQGDNSDKVSIPTTCNIKNNIVSFSVKGKYDKSRTMIIDPTFTWNTDPAFTDSPDKAYIVHSDNAGDVYVYGGGITGATPAAGPSFQLVQLNKNGVKQWTFNNPEHEAVILWILSGMCVDQCNGTAYIDWSGAGAGADEVLEISKQETTCTGVKPTIIGGVDPYDNIFTYSSNLHSIFIGAGDTKYQRIQFDTNLTLIAQNAGTETDNNHNAVMQALSPRQDTMFMITNTSNSNTYFDSLFSYPTANIANTNLLSFGTAGLGKSITHFRQFLISKDFVNFPNSGVVESNVFNGMAASNKYLYVYDGDTIAQLSKKTGLAIAEARLTSEMDFTATPPSPRGQNQWWGGIAVDTCADNLYVGFMDSINVYSGSSATPFALVSKTAMPLNTDTVYCLELKGNYDTLYAAGEGFVAALAPSAVSCSSVALPQCASSCPLTPLPITLLNFNCTPASSGIELNWATATETNNKYFTIERSDNGSEFTPIATIPGAGNSVFPKYYNYTDMNPLNGNNYYKLTQTDFWGNTEQDNITTCNEENTITKDSVLVYPNPSGGVFSVKISLAYIQPSSPLVISIYDLLGRKVYTQTAQNQTTTNMNISSLPSGLYILNITATEKTYVTKLLITK